ncbi:MAG: hypothetical protein WAN36_02565, partial [Calditrichia bacterium]
LHLSPLFITMITGITLAQFFRESEKIIRVIHQAEKPTYLFLLIFAGAIWNYRFLTEILLVALFVISRYGGKLAGGYIGSRTIDCAFEVPPDIGKALMSFGGISLAIAFNFQLLYGGIVGDFVMSATIVSIFLFDEYTAISALRILRRQGEAV